MRQRIERLLALIQDTGGDVGLSVPMRLCLASRRAIGVDGAGVSLIGADHHSSVAASDPLSSDIEELQAAFREGPCFDAVKSNKPVLAPDLGSDDVQERWPSFAPSALEAGVQSVFGFPLTFRGAPVGALDLYLQTRGSLSNDHIDDALVLADLTAIAVHDLSDRGRIAEVGVSSGLDEPWAHHAVVHHATGMISVHLGVPIDEALLRLRAFAFASSRHIDDVSRDIVARQLQLPVWGVNDE